MSDEVAAPPVNGTPVEQANLPPFVTVAKSPTGLTVQTNLPDKLMVLALLEGAKFSLMQPDKQLITRPNGMSGLLNRMGRR